MTLSTRDIAVLVAAEVVTSAAAHVAVSITEDVDVDSQCAKVPSTTFPSLGQMEKHKRLVMGQTMELSRTEKKERWEKRWHLQKS